MRVSPILQPLVRTILTALAINLVMPWQGALNRTTSVRKFGIASSLAASQYSLARVLTLKAVLRKLLIPSLIKSFLLHLLCLLQSEDLLNRRLLVRLGDIIVFVQVLRGLAQPAPVRISLMPTISPSRDTFSPRTKKSPRSISAHSA